jgi:hypothetical protein
MKKKIIYTVFCLLLLHIFASGGAVAKATPTPQSLITGEGTLFFIENAGQVTDQNGRARKDIQFKVSSPAMNLYIGSGHLHYEWARTKSMQQPQSGGQQQYGVRGAHSDVYRMDVVLKGADTHAVAMEEDRIGYHEQYVTTCTTLQAHACKKITFKNVYPYIDWVLYIKDKKVEYDFVVKPGGRIQDIQIAYAGATNISLTTAGSLLATTPMGSVSEQKPVSHIAGSNRLIATNFILKGNVVGFSAAAYKGTLVIDPTLAWATYYGGTGTENQSNFLTTCDNTGNVYLVGSTNNNGFTGSGNLATTGSYQSSLTGTRASFLVKFNSAGVRLWATYFGQTNLSASGAQIGAIACDKQGNVFITGTATDTSNIGTTSSSFQRYPNGPYNAFITKFDSSGNFSWSTYYGGARSETGTGIACDKNGNVFVAGQAYDTSQVATSGSYQSTYGGGNGDAFLVKFSNSGTRLWATYFGGNGLETDNIIAVDTTGNVYLTGLTYSTNLATTPGCFQSALTNSADGFIAKFTNAGAKIWATYFVYSTIISGIVSDKDNNVYIVGNTTSTNNIATAGSYQTTSNYPYQTPFIEKFDSAGNRQWGTYYGPSNTGGFANVAGVACDNLGNVFLCGRTVSPTGIATANAYQGSYSGIVDGYFAQFSNTGSRLWATYYGSVGTEFITDITCDNTGHVYIAGATTGYLNMANSSFQPTFGGGLWDNFLAKFTFSDTVVYLTTPFTDTVRCAGSTVSLPYFVTYPFHTGNTFTAQLSNALGSFANAISIGTVTSATSGTIACTLPASLPAGSGYRYRIIAASPADTSLDDGKNILIIKGAASTIAPVCVGDTLKIVAYDTGTSITYSWAGPNSFTSTAKKIVKPSTAYLDSGAYYLVESTTGCSVYDTIHVSVKSTPDKPAISIGSIICKGTAINLTANDTTSGVSWQWTGPNGFASASQNPVIAHAAFTDTGYYIVRVTLASCSGADTTHISVQAYPDTLTLTGKTTICIGDTVRLNGNAPNAGVTYSWTGANNLNTNTQNIIIPNATPSNTGFYYLAAGLGNNFCTLKDTLYVLVVPPPAITLADTFHSCKGGTITLLTGPATTGVQYAWHGPNGYYSSVQNTSITYIPFLDSGMYRVTATNSGCSITDSIYVIVAAPPVIPAPIYNNAICVGDSLKIICPPPAADVIYSWTGPSGYSSTQQSVIIQHAALANSGAYILTATNPVCSATIVISIAVSAYPSKPTIASNSPLCAGSTLAFNPAGTIGAIYSWIGPTGFGSVIKNATRVVTIADSGYYMVKATLNGCSVSDTAKVAIYAAPTSVTYSSNSPICGGDTLKVISNTPTLGATYAWAGPSGFNTAQQNFNIINTTQGNAGKYMLAVTYGVCTVYDTVTVVIKPVPATPVPVTNSPVCAGSPLNLSATNTTPGVGYIWNGPNSFSSLLQSPVINNSTTNSAGIYSVVSVLNGCTSAAGSTIAVIKQSPSGSMVSNSPVCTGDTLKFTGTASPTGVTYGWAGPNGFISNLQAPLIYPATAPAGGLYTLLLSLNGCTAAYSTPVSITPAGASPAIHIIAPVDTICSGDPLTFTATATNAVSPVYTWKVNGNNVSTVSHTYTATTLADGDMVTCTVTSNGACQAVHIATSNSIKIHVQAPHPPPVTISVYPSVYNSGVKVTFTAITPGSSNCFNYQWRLNGADIPGANSSSYESYKLNRGDKISLYIHSTCACTSPDTLLTNAIALGLENITAQDYNIYPDPAHDKVTISYAMPAGAKDIRIINAAGQVVRQLNTTGAIVTIPVSDLVNGVYVIQTIVNGRSITARFVKD